MSPLLALAVIDIPSLTGAALSQHLCFVLSWFPVSISAIHNDTKTTHKNNNTFELSVVFLLGATHTAVVVLISACHDVSASWIALRLSFLRALCSWRIATVVLCMLDFTAAILFFLFIFYFYFFSVCFCFYFILMNTGGSFKCVYSY